MIRSATAFGASIWDPRTGTVSRPLYFGVRVLSGQTTDALPVDLSGLTLLPGLINGHDHLELNHFPRSRFRERYDNAHQWGEDMNSRLDTSPYRELRAAPLRDRLFIGGLKNLLAGAMTVFHHNPAHRSLFSEDFPVTVIRKYGWAHSLHFDTAEAIRQSYQRTHPEVVWQIHLAEGTDNVAAEEYDALARLGCAGPNTVLVHGVGLSATTVLAAAGRVRGLVSCPSTNQYLLGQTADMQGWLAAGGRLALGSDSRLTADGDLLDELQACPLDGSQSLRLVTEEGAALLGLPDRGHLRPEAAADWIACEGIPRKRADLRLVVRAGVPQIGDPELMAQFPHIRTVEATLDGQPRAVEARLAERIHRCGLKEAGLEVDAPSSRRLFFRRHRADTGGARLPMARRDRDLNGTHDR